eukprot:5592859-Pleurochrysis_carterae.AAC.1
MRKGAGLNEEEAALSQAGACAHLAVARVSGAEVCEHQILRIDAPRKGTRNLRRQARQNPNTP